MKEDFAKDLARVLKSEGGKVDHPKDPGGRTNKGVTQRVYSGWLKANKLPQADVWNIRPEHVAAIYRREYWDKCGGDWLPTGVAYAVFDAAVNSGVSRAILWLQLALGTVRADGVLGPATTKAVGEYPNDDDLIQKMIDLRLRFVRRLKTYSTFGKGWERRYAMVRGIAQAEATGLPATPAVFMTGANGKAFVESAVAPPPTEQATVVVAGAGSGGAGTQALDQVQAFSAIPGVSNLVAVITIVLFVVAGAGGAYLWWARRKRKAIEADLNVYRPLPAPSNDNALVDDGSGHDEDDEMIAHLARLTEEKAA